MPETTITSSLLRPNECMARNIAPSTMPCPHPGQSMWGNMSSRKYSLKSNRSFPSRFQRCQDFLRGNGLSVGLQAAIDAFRIARGSLHFPEHLSQVHLGYDDAVHLFRQGGDLLGGERPERDRAKQSGPDSLRPGQAERLPRRRRNNAVREHHHLGVIAIHGFKLDDFPALPLDLVVQAPL